MCVWGRICNQDRDHREVRQSSYRSLVSQPATRRGAHARGRHYRPVRYPVSTTQVHPWLYTALNAHSYTTPANIKHPTWSNIFHRSNYANQPTNFSNKRQESFVFLWKHLGFTDEKALRIPKLQETTPFQQARASVRALYPPSIV